MIRQIEWVSLEDLVPKDHNRVEEAIADLSSHTTVRAMSHTAVLAL